jgi:Cu+-exporting ATPase
VWRGAQQPSPHELVIGGMTCAACAARVQAKLNRLDGVTASVNLSTERAWVSAPPDLSARALVDVVEAAGCAPWDDPVLGLRCLEQPAPAPFRPSPV